VTAIPELTPAAMALFKKFRLRHERQDAVADWRRADRANKPVCAFVAVALDPAVLDNLDSVAGHALARAARDYAGQLLEVADDPEKSAAAAAAMIVSAISSAWSAKHKLFRPKVEFVVGSAPVTPAGVLHDIWTSARRGYPQYDERTAGVCFLAVMQLGLDGLDQLETPELLTLGACRYVAWSVGGRLRMGTPAEEEDAAGTLSVVQLWSKARDVPVMHVSYTGRRGSPSQQALSLARDAAACARLAESRSDLVPVSGVGAWREAAERHAYAGVAMDPAAIMELDLDAAGEVAACAARFATAIEASNGEVSGGMVMPLFPSGAELAPPKTVRASLRRLLPEVGSAAAA
jgi:hypothetical protein